MLRYVSCATVYCVYGGGSRSLVGENNVDEAYLDMQSNDGD